MFSNIGARSPDLAKLIVQGTEKGEGKRGRQKKKWVCNVFNSGQGCTLLAQLGQLKSE